MSIESLRDNLRDEIRQIVSPSFDVLESPTSEVPTLDDSAITYPNLDTQKMNCRAIETCVLHVDMRSSTKKSLSLRHPTLAKLYSSFIRAMARCACEYGGEVRGIVGDRLMVVFPRDRCFSAAVNTAVLMHSVTKHILNPMFTYDDVSCGIGIDYGKMLVIKAGIVRHGQTNADHKSLVWIGRPANIASKLTDAANKPLNPPSAFAAAGVSLRSPAILISEQVWRGYLPGWRVDAEHQFQRWSPFARGVECYPGKVYGGNVVERAFLPPQLATFPKAKRPGRPAMWTGTG